MPYPIQGFPECLQVLFGFGVQNSKDVHYIALYRSKKYWLNLSRISPTPDVCAFSLVTMTPLASWIPAKCQIGHRCLVFVRKMRDIQHSATKVACTVQQLEVA